MECNENNSGEKPENWITEEAEQKYIFNPKAKLTDWYHIDLHGLSHEQAVLRRQETNYTTIESVDFILKIISQ